MGYQVLMHGESFNPTELRKRERKDRTDFLEMYQGPMYHYWIDYTQYIRDRILDGTIHPAEILRTGGVTTLNYIIDCEPVRNFVCEILQSLIRDDNLSKNKQIMYFCLIDVLDYYNYNDKELEYITDFKSNNKEFLSEFKKELLKDFPEFSRR